MGHPKGIAQAKLANFNLAKYEPRSTTPIDAWASLNAVVDGKALFQVPGGILTVNVVRPEAPRAQAYFPLNGWPSRLVPTADGVREPQNRRVEIVLP